MIENQKEGQEHQEKAKEKKEEEPSVPQEGRKLYGTKFGEKYHFDRFCKGFNGHQNYEWKSCPTCNEKSKEVLDLSNPGSTSSSSTDTEVKDDTLRFELKNLGNSNYHSEDCTVRQAMAKGTTDKKTMCQLCAKDERLLVSLRSRHSNQGKK